MLNILISIAIGFVIGWFYPFWLFKRYQKTDRSICRDRGRAHCMDNTVCSSCWEKREALHREACLLLAEASLVFDKAKARSRVDLVSFGMAWREKYRDLIKRMAKANLTVNVIMLTEFGRFGDDFSET
jgi:hypothetical protein